MTKDKEAMIDNYLATIFSANDDDINEIVINRKTLAVRIVIFGIFTSILTLLVFGHTPKAISQQSGAYLIQDFVTQHRYFLDNYPTLPGIDLNQTTEPLLLLNDAPLPPGIGFID